MADQEFKHLVRIANTDLDGNKPVSQAMLKIKGIGPLFSNMVCKLAGVENDFQSGKLSDAQVKKLDEVITDPKKFGAPDWMLNRRSDYETGQTLHLLGGDLKYSLQNDKKRLAKIKSYRGLRLSTGHTVRGQRTKSNFRRSKARGGGGLGVKRKK